nr:PREDICTED: uncharacterized protein LOC107077947 [Lepisosteus oculatus]XP_015207388.1 PREDICTED: uncharacterized protein LOC107077947 [Lepisosteus oculatus]
MAFQDSEWTDTLSHCAAQNLTQEEMDTPVAYFETRGNCNTFVEVWKGPEIPIQMKYLKIEFQESTLTSKLEEEKAGLCENQTMNEGPEEQVMKVFNCSCLQDIDGDLNLSDAPNLTDEEEGEQDKQKNITKKEMTAVGLMERKTRQRKKISKEGDAQLTWKTAQDKINKFFGYQPLGGDLSFRSLEEMKSLEGKTIWRESAKDTCCGGVGDLHCEVAITQSQDSAHMSLVNKNPPLNTGQNPVFPRTSTEMSRPCKSLSTFGNSIIHPHKDHICLNVPQKHRHLFSLGEITEKETCFTNAHSQLSPAKPGKLCLLPGEANYLSILLSLPGAYDAPS